MADEQKPKKVQFDLHSEESAHSKASRFTKEKKDLLYKPVKTLSEKWRLLVSFFAVKGIVRQHMDSFDYFIQTEIKHIVRANSNRFIRSEVDPAFFIEFLDIRIGAISYENGSETKYQTPMSCRIHDATYQAPILVDVDFYKKDKIIRRKNIEIGKLPIMLRSCACILRNKTPAEIQKLGECPHDPGGYFIVKGTERVILMQEQLSRNRIIIEYDYKHCLSALITSSTAEAKSRTVVVYKNKKIYLRHNSFVDDIPICIVLYAMGIEADQEMFQMVGSHDKHMQMLFISLYDAYAASVTTQEQALLYLGRKLRPKYKSNPADLKSEGSSKKNLINEAVNMLHRIVLAHVPSQGNDFRLKARFLCLMISRLIDALENPELIDDKDYYGNKRLELAGQLISLMFEDLFKRFCSQLSKQVDQSLTRYHQAQARIASSTALKKRDSPLEYPDCCSNLPSDIITRGMQSAISTGNWTIKRFRMERLGVSQVLSRFSFLATLGMMTRLTSNVEKGRKVSGPRSLQPSQWGMVCPCDTPEGESCGLVKNLALMTQVTTDNDPLPLENIAYALGVEDSGCLIETGNLQESTALVFLNGLLLGIHKRPYYFIFQFRRLRRCGKIGPFISIFVNSLHNAIYIASDSGRLCRPLIIVENGVSRLNESHLKALEEKKIDFNYFLNNGIIEWVDVNEENDLYIAMYESNITMDTTHVEIDPLTIIGVVAGVIPYPHHNQSPRNTYQCAMGKQAMGAIAYNMFNRVDTVLYLLVYPQKPLCTTRTIELIQYDELPAGQNASVAIMSYSGYDIEDAIVMNKASIDRGFGRCFVMKRSTVELKKNYFNGTFDRVFSPKNVGEGIGVQSYRDKVLDSDGVVRVGELIHDEQIYVNKYVPLNTKDPILDPSELDISSYKPAQAKYKTPQPSYVDRVILTENPDNEKIYKVVFRQTRRPEYGDKFSSRHGQKGVIGCIVPQEDMPFNECGWCPDLIMNPHGFPSRMTVGKMIELIAGKSSLMDGILKYGTAFGGTSVNDIGNILISHGYHYSGKEYLTSGITGQAIESYVFVGPIYYQKLKHMVQDKIHARGRGPRQLITRQPTEGRAKDGGLRFGEMERDCLVSYGTANLLLERLMLSSDAFDAYACKECGLLGYQGWCSYCKTGKNICQIKMPYACKLLFQEMMTMNVVPRLELKEV